MHNINKILNDANLKVTPQRVAVINALFQLKNHPTAERIISFLSKKFPHIAIGTVYKILDLLVQKEIVKKVLTENDIMRYDVINDKHHHLYCSETDRIEDYYDEELHKMIENYFKKKNIPDFKMQNFKLQICGKFINQS